MSSPGTIEPRSGNPDLDQAKISENGETHGHFPIIEGKDGGLDLFIGNSQASAREIGPVTPTKGNMATGTKSQSGAKQDELMKADDQL